MRVKTVSRLAPVVLILHNRLRARPPSITMQPNPRGDALRFRERDGLLVVHPLSGRQAVRFWALPLSARDCRYDIFWACIKTHTSTSFNDILEIGVGPNGFTPFYAEHRERLDVDEHSKHYEDLPSVKIITCDGTRFPLPEPGFDLVASHSTFGDHQTRPPGHTGEHKQSKICSPR
jgi:hypothetical protein